jgi:hypothetical protein
MLDNDLRNNYDPNDPENYETHDSFTGKPYDYTQRAGSVEVGGETYSPNQVRGAKVKYVATVILLSVPLGLGWVAHKKMPRLRRWLNLQHDISTADPIPDTVKMAHSQRTKINTEWTKP